MTTHLRAGDRIRFAYNDKIHGRFEAEGDITFPAYSGNGELEYVHVSVGNRDIVVMPGQILEPQPLDPAANNTPTAAQLATARGWLLACADMTAPDLEAAEAMGERIKALTDEQLVAKTVRLWPKGWDNFCEYFADDIRAAAAQIDA